MLAVTVNAEESLITHMELVTAHEVMTNRCKETFSNSGQRVRYLLDLLLAQGGPLDPPVGSPVSGAGGGSGGGGGGGRGGGAGSMQGAGRASPVFELTFGKGKEPIVRSAPPDVTIVPL